MTLEATLEEPGDSYRWVKASDKWRSRGLELVLPAADLAASSSLSRSPPLVA